MPDADLQAATAPDQEALQADDLTRDILDTLRVLTQANVEPISITVTHIVGDHSTSKTVKFR